MKSVLLPFQCATRDIALTQLQAPAGARRFLIADEVGLGKTVVTREILRKLVEVQSSAGRPLNVFYIANNLNVAAQNRDSLAKAVHASAGDSREERNTRKADRLSLLATQGLRPLRKGLRLYSLTLDTSVPTLRGGNPLGKMEERATVVALLDRLWPRLAADEDAFDGSPKSWSATLKYQCKALADRPDAAVIARRFREALRKVLDVAPGRQVESVLRAWVKALPEGKKRWRPFMARMRTALALAALSRHEVRPDLVILDEFQKFPEILAVRPEGKVAAALQDRALRLLVDGLMGKDGRNPAVLLLSATPYKMHPAQQLRAGEGSDQLYDDFYRIVEFLNGSDGESEAKELKVDFRSFERLLFDSSEETPDRRTKILGMKQRIERRLRRIMARTERSDDPAYAQQTVHQPVEAVLKSDDLVIFDDFADRLRRVAKPKKRRSATRRKPSRIGMVVPLWTSVPYPMQTLGRGYVAWNDAQSVSSQNRLGRVGEIRQPKAAATRDATQALRHPKLRALVGKVASPVDLALPWMPPTLKWWRLGGVWKRFTSEEGRSTPPTKTLLFSRFRIAPAVIAGLVSLVVERTTAPRQYAYRHLPRSSRFRSGGDRSSPGVAAAFFPWPWLIKAVDPRKDSSADSNAILTEAAQSLRKWLKDRGVEVRRSTRKQRPTWKLVAAIAKWIVRTEEADLFARDGTIGQIVYSAVANALVSELESWRKEASAVEMKLSLAEVKAIAQFALGAPGIVLGRAVLRHWQGGLDVDNLGEVFEVSWSELRPYVGHRYFDHALAKSRRGPADDVTPLMNAIIAGNLEAVLDEQLALWSRVGSLVGGELLDELKTVLSLQTGRMTVHPRSSTRKNGTGSKGRSAFVIRSHAALPFVDGSDRSASKRPSRKATEGDVKGERLKRAFNSPFWPHMLTTTSMGQEGLDFHLWCKRIVHWDLPTNPVDLEQREGRVSRYAGLSVRDVLAVEKGAVALAVAAVRPFASPWLELFAIVDGEAVGKAAVGHPGLTPWWVLPTASLSRVVLEMPMSEQAVRLERILDDVLYYRLALGQPDVKHFVERARALGPGEARAYVIDLSPLRFRQ